MNTTAETQDSGFNPSYVGERRDVLEWVPEQARTILDVGCSVGALGEAIKQRCPGATVCGIEYDTEMAEQARESLDEVLVGDLEDFPWETHFSGRSFDCIILADVLEHLRDPWAVLSAAAGFLSPTGLAIVSMPNVRHLSSLCSVIFRGEWPYRSRGVHDATHLRFFTLKNILQLIDQAGLATERIRRNYRVFDQGRPTADRLCRCFAVPVLREFLAYQYVIAAKPKP